MNEIGYYHDCTIVFVPFLGDFLSIRTLLSRNAPEFIVFVPFLGDFLSINSLKVEIYDVSIVFVPFLGDFLSIREKRWQHDSEDSFRPLSWGLSFNKRA